MSAIDFNGLEGRRIRIIQVRNHKLIRVLSAFKVYSTWGRIVRTTLRTHVPIQVALPLPPFFLPLFLPCSICTKHARRNLCWRGRPTVWPDFAPCRLSFNRLSQKYGYTVKQNSIKSVSPLPELSGSAWHVAIFCLFSGCFILIWSLWPGEVLYKKISSLGRGGLN